MLLFGRSLPRLTPRATAFITALTGLALLFACSSDDGPPTTPDDDGPPVNTVDTIPPADIDGLVTATTTSAWIILHWQAPGDDGWTGTAAEYDIRYSTSPITAQNWDTALYVTDEPAPNPGGQLQVHMVTGLKAARQYYFAMKTRDEVPNESGLSNVATGTTLQEYVPPSPVADLQAAAVDDSSFLLRWTATGDNGNTGTASQYDVRYSLSGINEANWDAATQATGEPTPKPSGEPESLVVSGLLAEENYSFAMKVADAVPNWSGLSNPCFSLGYSVFLWAYPALVHRGEELTIVYRAQQNSHVLVELLYWQIPRDCGNGYQRLFTGTYPQDGTHSMTYDCINPYNQNYIPYNWYTVRVCIDGVQQGTSFRFEFAE